MEKALRRFNEADAMSYLVSLIMPQSMKEHSRFATVRDEAFSLGGFAALRYWIPAFAGMTKEMVVE